jgi:hypothetical protein
MNFDLSGVNAGCAMQWQYAFGWAQEQTGMTLQAALTTFPGPHAGYEVVIYQPGDWRLNIDKHGDDWLVSESLRLSGRVIGATEQADGVYVFTTRYCFCPNDTVLYFP